MTAQIIDGKALSKQLRVGFRERVGRLVEQGVRPGLAVILVGDNPASRVYVGNKVKAWVQFRGRDIIYKEQGLAVLERFIEALADISKVAKVTSGPIRLGRICWMRMRPRCAPTATADST